MPKKAGERKPADKRKTQSIHIRVTEDQRQTLHEAAERDGALLSPWLLNLGYRRAAETKPTTPVAPPEGDD